MSEFRMPSLGADMEAGTVVAWLVKPGDRVKHGDIVAEVETEKGVFDVEIESDGVVDELAVAKGAKVPVGTVLARLRSDVTAPEARAPEARAPETRAPEARAPEARAPEARAPEAPAPAAPTAPAPPTTLPARRIRVSPLARRVAEAKAIDLARVTGTGTGGAITKADVEHAATEAPATIAPAIDAALLAMRHAVAAAVTRSNREIPHYYLGADVNLGRAIAWLTAQNEARAITNRILPAAMLLKSVAQALKKYPMLNGVWTDTIHPADAIHLGVAVSLRGGGLIAPAIHNADRLSIDELMRALSDLVRRARSGGLRSSEMSGATITISNLGDGGADSVFGIIYPPQVALVGLGKIRDRPWAESGMLGVRPIVTVTLAADHRATDGHYGSQFLAEIDRLLQAPESL